MGKLELTQFVHPYGEQVKTSVELPDDVLKMAENQIVTCECMPHNYDQVVFYSRMKDQDEEDEDIEIGKNGPGENSPVETLKKLITRVYENSKNEVKNG